MLAPFACARGRRRDPTATTSTTPPPAATTTPEDKNCAHLARKLTRAACGCPVWTRQCAAATARAITRCRGSRAPCACGARARARGTRSLERSSRSAGKRCRRCPAPCDPRAASDREHRSPAGVTAMVSLLENSRRVSTNTRWGAGEAKWGRVFAAPKGLID